MRRGSFIICLALLMLLPGTFAAVGCASEGPAGGGRKRDQKASVTQAEFTYATAAPSETEESLASTAAETERAPVLSCEEKADEDLLLDFLREEMNRPDILGQDYAYFEPVHYLLFYDAESILEAASAEREILEEVLEKEGWPEGTIGVYLIVDKVLNEEERLSGVCGDEDESACCDGTDDFFILLIPQGKGYRPVCAGGLLDRRKICSGS